MDEKRYCEECSIELLPERAPDYLCDVCRAIENCEPTHTCYECDSPIGDSDRQGAVLCDVCLSMLMSVRSNWFTQASVEWEKENARRERAKNELLRQGEEDEE